MLVRLGWDDERSVAWEAREEPGEPGEPGRVARGDRGEYALLTAGGPRRARVHPELRTPDPVARPAVGDWVVVGELDGEAVITELLPRRSAFVRGDPLEGRAVAAQVVAANVDVVFVVQSLADGPNLRRLERELVLTWESGALPVVVLNKADLCDDALAAVRAVEAVALDATVELTSCVTGRGIERLHDHARPDRTVALIGASGVGKSTLVNRLVGADVRDTAEVRAGDQRGRHTTIARELILLEGGGVLIDTPGLRALSLWDVDSGLARAFADVEQLADGCRFRDCAHREEPGCAVRAAVAAGDLDGGRLASYLRLLDELDRLDEEAEQRLRALRGRRPRPDDPPRRTVRRP